MVARHEVRQSAATPAGQAQRDLEVPGRLRDRLGPGIAHEVYFSTDEAAQLVGRPSRAAFIKWARRHAVPLRRPAGGRALVVKKSDLDWALRVR